MATPSALQINLVPFFDLPADAARAEYTVTGTIAGVTYSVQGSTLYIAADDSDASAAMGSLTVTVQAKDAGGNNLGDPLSVQLPVNLEELDDEIRAADTLPELCVEPGGRLCLELSPYLRASPQVDDLLTVVATTTVPGARPSDPRRPGPSELRVESSSGNARTLVIDAAGTTGEERIELVATNRYDKRVAKTFDLHRRGDIPVTCVGVVHVDGPARSVQEVIDVSTFFDTSAVTRDTLYRVRKAYPNDAVTTRAELGSGPNASMLTITMGTEAELAWFEVSALVGSTTCAVAIVRVNVTPGLAPDAINGPTRILDGMGSDMPCVWKIQTGTDAPAPNDRPRQARWNFATRRLEWVGGTEPDWLLSPVNPGDDESLWKRSAQVTQGLKPYADIAPANWGNPVRADLIGVDTERTFDLSRIFSHPYGGDLDYKVLATVNAGLVGIKQDGAELTLIPGRRDGPVTLEVRVSDPARQDIETLVSVMELNVFGSAPAVEYTPPEPLTGNVGDTRTINLLDLFSTGDGYQLAFDVGWAEGDGQPATLARPSPTQLRLTYVAGLRGSLAIRASNGVRVNDVVLPVHSRELPVLSTPLPDVQLTIGTSRTIDLDCHFHDPDGGTPTFTVDVAPGLPPGTTARVSRTSLVINAPASGFGSGNVTVIADNGSGRTATAVFALTVTSRPPVVTMPLLDRQIVAGQLLDIDLAQHFSDPDMDTMTFTASSSGLPAGTTADASRSTLSIATGSTVGTGTVTVRATDPSGAFVEDEFSVEVTNQAPILATGFPATIFLELSTTEDIDLTQHFRDPDGHALTYRAQTSGLPTGTTATVSDAVLTLTAGANAGSGTVTVIARDTVGHEARGTFTFTARPNQAPTLDTPLPDLALNKGESRTIDLTRHFSDPEMRDIVFTASSMGLPAGATVVVNGTDLVLTGGSRSGSGTVTVRATDNRGATTDAPFMLTVRNRAPVVSAAIPDTAVGIGQSRTIDLSAHFSDPDNDALTYEATATGRGTAVVNGTQLRLSGGSTAGSGSVVVTASDGDGGSVRDTFAVTVKAPPVVTTPIPDRLMNFADTARIDLTQHFREPGGASLVFSVSSPALPTGTTAVVQGNTLLVITAGRTNGAATVTVTARTPDGLQVQDMFQLRVSDGTPVLDVPLPDVTLERGQSHTIDLTDHFLDPEMATLTYTVSSQGLPTGTTAVVQGTNLVLTAGTTAGTSGMVTVRATDPTNRFTEDTLALRVLVPGQFSRGFFGPSRARAPRENAFGHGMWSDGTYLYVADRADRHVYVYDIAAANDLQPDPRTLQYTDALLNTTRVLAREFDLHADNARAADIWSDGTTMWVQDTADRKVYAYSLSARTRNAALEFDTNPAGGIWSDGTTMWVANRAYALVGGRPDPSKDLAAGVGGAFAQWSDGTTMWDDTGAAYHMGTGVRVTEWEFDLPRFSRQVTRGIWSDGTTMWACYPSLDREGVPQFTAIGGFFMGDFGDYIPTLDVALPDVLLTFGLQRAINLDDHFSELGGQTLTYTVSSSGLPTGTTAVVLDSTLTLSAGTNGGSGTVTVRATDPGGKFVEDTLTLTARANRAPVLSLALTDATLLAGTSATERITLDNHFNEPDGETLTYAVSSTGLPTGATAVLEGGNVLVLAAGDTAGTGTVTVTARDPAGLTAAATVRLTVTNQAPAVSATIPDVSLFTRGTRTIALGDHFSDPDGHALTYTASSSGLPTGTTAVVSGTNLVLTAGGSAGSGTVTVTARDLAGDTAQDEFALSVRVNRRPVLTAALPDVKVALHGRAPRTIELDDHFREPDGSALFYSVSSSGLPAGVTAILSDSTLTLDAGATAGTGTVTVTARDPEGLSVQDTLTLTAVAVPTATAIPAQTVSTGGTVTLDLAPYFSSSDDLTYAVASTTLPAGATAEVVGSTLTITAGSTSGVGSVQVRATDSVSQSVSAGISVTVRANRAPTVSTPLGAVFLARRATRTIDLNAHFSDPDMQALTYTAATSRLPSGTTVRVSGTNLVVRTGSISGSATVTVTARDPGGRTVSDTLQLGVGDVPLLLRPLPRRTLPRSASGRDSVDLNDHFRANDGSALTYSVAPTQRTNGVQVEVTNVSRLSVSVTDDAALRSTTFTVTARHRFGPRTTAQYVVTVSATARGARQATLDLTLPWSNARDRLSPAQMVGNATHLWLLDTTNSRSYVLRAHRLTDGAAVPSRDITLGSWRRQGQAFVATDGTTVWVRRSSVAMAWTLATGARDSSKDITFTGLDGNVVGGIAVDATRLWVADVDFDNDDAGNLRAYLRSNGSHDSARDIALPSDWQALGGSDIWPAHSDGTTVWVRGNDVLAYTIATGARDEAKDSLVNVAVGDWISGTSWRRASQGFGDLTAMRAIVTGYRW